MIGSLTSLSSLTTNTLKIPDKSGIILDNNNISVYSSSYTGSMALLNSNASDAFSLASNFTIEAWVYISNPAVQNQTIIGLGNQTNNGRIYYNYNGNMTFSFICETNTIATNVINSNQTVYPYSWTHVAVTRNSSTITIYVDGIGTSLTNSNYAANFTQTGISFGRINPYQDSDFFYGLLSRVNMSTSVLYSSNFIPPTTLLTSNGNMIWNFVNTANGLKNITPIVMNFNNSVGIVNRGPSTISKMRFNGSNFLSYVNTQQILLGSGAYTIECFFRLNGSNLSTSNNPLVLLSVGQNPNYRMEISPSLSLNVKSSNIKYSLSNRFPGNNNWHHCAITRNSSGLVRIWLDGSLGYTTTESPLLNMTTNSNILIGRNTDTNQFLPNNSEITKIRISGTERYNTNFTPNIRMPYLIDSNDWIVFEFISYDNIYNSSGAISLTLNEGDANWSTE